ncbi:MAG: Rrf2 family transcriptional regulator, partial [Candidatus Poribacteria bacterium]|nr:Rrf2 family transcriptional regulator [Candidatus Poribacteria bacterium]
MLLSRSSEYAVQALLYIAKSSDKMVLAKEISDRQSLALPFLGKILLSLVKGGLLKSQKGRGGGFSLAVPPDEITLIQMVHII